MGSVYGREDVEQAELLFGVSWVFGGGLRW